MVILRRRRASLADELRSIAEDVLGRERAVQLWNEAALPGEDEPAARWAEALPELVRATQTHYGRGLARELNGQLRLALEEYR
jgi:sigma-B regulation protein RsbU (phosphoserine phosphatase)